MATVRDLIQDALIEIGVCAPTETMTAEDASFGLRTLKRLAERWNVEKMMPYGTVRTVYTLTAGQQSYTLGTGGNLNGPKPEVLEMVSVIPDSGAPEIAMEILTAEEWRDVSVKATNGTFPVVVYPAKTEPLETLYFWPIPQTACQVVIYGKVKLDLSTLDTVIQLPQGYDEALVTNLAVMLSSSYGRQPNPVLALRAAASSSILKSANAQDMSICSDLGGGASLAVRSFGYVVDRL